MREKREVAAEMQERSAFVDKTAQYMYSMCLKHVHSAMKDNALYSKHTNCERLIMYELQSPKMPRAFEWLSYFATMALVNIKLKTLTRFFAAPGKPEHVVEIQLPPGTPALLLMKRKEEVYAANLLRFRENSLFYITVLRAKGSISIELLQLTK